MSSTYFSKLKVTEVQLSRANVEVPKLLHPTVFMLTNHAA